MLCMSREELFVGQQRQCFLSHRTGNPLRGAEYSCDLALEGSSFQNSWAINGEQLVSSKGDSAGNKYMCHELSSGMDVSVGQTCSGLKMK